LQTTARYISNNTASHFQAVDDAEKLMESVLSSAPSDAETPQKLSQNLSPTNNGGLNNEAGNIHN